MNQHLARTSSRRADIKFVISGSRRGIALLTSVALVAALSEAFVLGMLVQAVAAISRGRETLRIDVGPIALDSSVSTILGVTVALAALRVLLLSAIALGGPRVTSASRARMRRRLFSSYVRANWATQSADKSGRLLQAMSSSVNEANGVLMSITQSLPPLLTVSVLLTVALAVDPVIAGSLTLIGVALGAALRPITRAGRRYSRRDAVARTETTAHVAGVLTAGAEIASLGSRPGVIDVADARIHTAESAFAKAQGLNRLGPVATQSLVFVLAAAGMWLLSVAHWDVDFATIGTITVLLLRCAGLAQQVQTAFVQFNAVSPIIEQVRTLVHHYERNQQRFGDHSYPSEGDITLTGITYRYPGRDHDAVRIDEARLRQGSAVAVLGPSGSGKSTLVQLLLRLRTPTTGVIRVGDVRLEHISERSFTDNVAYVPQSAHLVPATIGDNIRFFRPGFSDEAVEHAARLAHVHDEIAALAHGYDTMLDAHVDMLSGGQKQRLALARALIAQPQVIILDEPTSALDSENEERVIQTLRGLGAKTTVIIITHRPSTVSHCDAVLRVVDGRLVSDDPDTVLGDNEPGAMRSGRT